MRISFSEANKNYLEKNYDEAISIYEELSELHPNLKECLNFQIDLCKTKKIKKVNEEVEQEESSSGKALNFSKKLHSVYNEYYSGWTAIITLWKRHEYLDEQLSAITNQTIPPKDIIIIKNENHFSIPPETKNKYKLKIIQSDINSLYTRWIVGYLADSEYVCVFDDDVIPGEKWIELCMTTSKKYNALIGPSGRRARPTNDPAWVSVENKDSGKAELCDWVCNSYFFKTSWIQHLVQSNRYLGYQKTFDDIQLATSLKIYGGINTVVPAQPKNDPAFNGHSRRNYGHDEHALWKRQPTEHLLKRNELIKKLDNAGFAWCKIQK